MHKTHENPSSLVSTKRDALVLKSLNPVPLGHGAVGLCAEDVSEIIISDAQADDRYEAQFDAQNVNGAEIRSMICVPLVSHRGNIEGVFQLIDKVKVAREAADAYFTKSNVGKVQAEHAASLIRDGNLHLYYKIHLHLRQAFERARQESFEDRGNSDVSADRPHAATLQIAGDKKDDDEGGSSSEGDDADFANDGDSEIVGDQKVRRRVSLPSATTCKSLMLAHYILPIRLHRTIMGAPLQK